MIKNKEKIIIGIIGLGYVGLPLLNSFKKKYRIIGYDIDKNKISNLEKKRKNRNKSKLIYTYDASKLKKCNVFIVTVPTPIDRKNIPDLTLLKRASKIVGQNINNQNIVIFESTVFPGATEDICVPIIKKYSNLEFINSDKAINNKGFYCGYSPERINPGDKKNKFENIIKVVSGSTPKALKFVSSLYASVVKAGVYETKNIITAESAKIIENVQRDLNIALINELSMLFNKLEINTQEVLNAANSKWNFQMFTPGLVGGHCIGVDPYYLVKKAKDVGFKTKLITQGRKINDNMSKYVVVRTTELMRKNKIKVEGSNILILGFTFKENLEDVRNSKVYDIYKHLKKLGSKITVYDPVAIPKEVKEMYKINLTKKLKNNFYDAIILAVAHSEFKKMKKNDFLRLCKDNSVIYDVKNILPKNIISGSL